MARVSSKKGPELSLNLPAPAVRPLITDAAGIIQHVRAVIHRQSAIQQADDTFPGISDVTERRSWSERWLDDLSYES